VNEVVVIAIVASMVCVGLGVALAGHGLKEKGKKLKEKAETSSPFKQRLFLVCEGVAAVCLVWFVFWAHLYGSVFWGTSMIPLQDPEFPMHVLGYLASANALAGLEIVRRGGRVYLPPPKLPPAVVEKKMDKSLESLLQVVESLNRFGSETYPEPKKLSESIALPEASDFKT
jgi:hypothetical protein